MNARFRAGVHPDGFQTEHAILHPLNGNAFNIDRLRLIGQEHAQREFHADRDRLVALNPPTLDGEITDLAGSDQPISEVIEKQLTGTREWERVLCDLAMVLRNDVGPGRDEPRP